MLVEPLATDLSISVGVHELDPDLTMAAFEAGCDMVLVCNAPAEAERLLSGLGSVSLDAALAKTMKGDATSRNADAYPAASNLVNGAFA